MYWYEVDLRLFCGAVVERERKVGGGADGGVFKHVSHGQTNSRRAVSATAIHWGRG